MTVYHSDPRHMLSPPALGSSRRVGGANGDAPGSRRSSQEALWGRLSSQEAVGSNSRQSVLGRLTTLAGSRRNLGPPERRSSTDNLGLPSTRAPTLGAAGRKGSFFIPEVPRCCSQLISFQFEHVLVPGVVCKGAVRRLQAYLSLWLLYANLNLPLRWRPTACVQILPFLHADQPCIVVRKPSQEWTILLQVQQEKQ